ncbi:MAG: TrkA family potassium uptake protein [Eggerthellales bacterium]|nr:TrkA family potassium uptake protein [Eggerthellales bacterium]
MHIIIMGAGKVGEYLARASIDAGNEVVLIETDEERASEMAEVLTKRCTVLHGDGCDSTYLLEAGIANTDVFVAASGHDDSNLVACELAQRVHEVSRCIARVNNPKNVRIFRKLGIESVSSTVLIAHMIEEEAALGSMNAVSTLNQNGIGLVEFSIPAFKGHDPALGVMVQDLNLPENCSVVAVGTSDGFSIATEETVLHPTDTVVMAAETEAIRKARQVIRGL